MVMDLVRDVPKRDSIMAVTGVSHDVHYEITTAIRGFSYIFYRFFYIKPPQIETSVAEYIPRKWLRSIIIRQSDTACRDL